MRNWIAWTLTVVAVGSLVAPASGQGTQKAAPKGQAGQVQAPAKGATQPKPLTAEEIKARQAADIKAKAAMVPILAEWEKQSKKVTNLSVGFERVDKSAAWGNEYFYGTALLKSPNFACLQFQKAKLDADRKPVKKLNAKGQKTWELEPEPTERVICNGKNVLQFVFNEKVIYVFPLEKEARTKALQEGPLPFLFNMKADEATRRYGMRLLQENEEEYMIAIVPNDPEDRGNFERAFLWLRKDNFLPNRLRLYPVQGGSDQAKESQEFTFSVIDATRPIDDSYFNPSIKMAGWQTKVNPIDGARPAATNAPAATRPVQPKQATKPGGRVQ